MPKWTRLEVYAPATFALPAWSELADVDGDAGTCRSTSDTFLCSPGGAGVDDAICDDFNPDYGYMTDAHECKDHEDADDAVACARRLCEASELCGGYQFISQGGLTVYLMGTDILGPTSKAAGYACWKKGEQPSDVASSYDDAAPAALEVVKTEVIYEYAGNMPMVKRTVVAVEGGAYAHAFARTGWDDGSSEAYQWLVRVDDEVAPVSASDATPCPSLQAAKNGQCAAVAVAYEPKFRTAYHHAGQATPKPTPGPGGVYAGGDWARVSTMLVGVAAYDLAGANALSGDGAVVARGAKAHSPDAVELYQAGRVDVFARGPLGWVQRGGPIVGDGKQALAGAAVALSGDGAVVAVGSPWHDGHALGPMRGQVRVFAWVNEHDDDDFGGWVLRGDALYGSEDVEEFGSAVALDASGTTLVVGSESFGVLKTGRATVYEFKQSRDAWVTKGEPLDGGDGDGAGSAVDVSDDGAVVVVAGAAASVGAGRVRAFDWASGAWVERTKNADLLEGDAANDAFGRSVSLSGDGLTVAVGATQPPVFVEAGCGAGYVKVFAWKNGNKWVQQKTTLEGGQAGDCLGRVALDGDGSTLAVGAPGARAERGSLQVYDLSQSGWHAAGSELIGENKGDIFGAYPSLSDDGKTLSVAAPRFDEERGAVSVYAFA